MKISFFFFLRFYFLVTLSATFFTIRASGLSEHPALDSLTASVDKAKTKEDRLYKLFELIEYYQDNAKEIDYLITVQEAEKIALELNDKYAINYVYYLFGGYHLIYPDFDKASHYFSLALFGIDKLEPNKKTLKLEIQINLALSAYYYYLANLPTAIEKLNRVEYLNTRLKDDYYALVHKNNLAIIYKSLNENEKAISLFEEVLSKDITLNHRQMIYANLGSTFLNTENPDSSIYYLNKSLSISKQSRKNYSTANTLALLGAAYQSQKKYVKALKTLEEAIPHAKKNKEDNILGEILIQIADLYVEIGSYDSALKYTNEGLEVARRTRNISGEAFGVKLRSKILYSKGDAVGAYKEQEYYQILSDSLNASLNIKHSNSLIEQNKLVFLQQKLEFEFKNAQIKILYTHKIQIFILISILVFLASGIGVVLILLKQKNIQFENKKLSEESLLNALEMKNKEFTSNLMFQMKRNEMLQEIMGDLSAISKDLELDKKEEINLLHKKISKIGSEDSWTDFEYQFKQVYQSFYDNLLAEFSNLSLSERKLCAFLKLNLTIKEIAAITNLDPNSIRVARVRLRKKLGLTNDEQTLIQFLSKF